MSDDFIELLNECSARGCFNQAVGMGMEDAVVDVVVIQWIVAKVKRDMKLRQLRETEFDIYDFDIYRNDDRRSA